MSKRFYLPAVLIVVFNAVSAQFSEPLFLSNTQQKTITQIGCADFTNDGLVDILTSHHFFPNHLLNLYIQTPGFAFSEQPAIPDSLGDIHSFAIGDINNDTRHDFVLAHHWPSSIVWYENVNETFIQHLVDTGLDITQKVLLADLDQNNKPDIISLQHLEIVIYLANDAGSFHTARVIHDGTEFYDIDVADYNQDGFMDVTVASSGFETLLNDGHGNFSLLPKNGNEFTFGLRSGDLDQDGDNDIVSYVALNGLVFYKNDGFGSFTSASAVLNSVDIFDQYAIMDLDCDHINDVYTTLQQSGQPFWMKNNGEGQFSDPQILYTQPGEIVSSSLAFDVNSDDNPDLLWGNLHFGIHLNECTSTGAGITTDPNIFTIYPNPTMDDVVFHNQSPLMLETILTDQLGMVISHDDITAGMQKQISLLAKGIYFLHIIHNGQAKDVRKLVKL